MNVLQLVRYAPQGWSEQAVRILIDGRDLIDIAAAVEREFAEAEGHPTIAGGYEGLPLIEARQKLQVSTEDSKRSALLVCQCGEEGCWPLVASVSSTQDRITWADFAQPHRRHWDLSSLGPFVFEREQYDEAIRAVDAI